VALSLIAFSYVSYNVPVSSTALSFASFSSVGLVHTGIDVSVVNPIYFPSSSFNGFYSAVGNVSLCLLHAT